MTKVLPTLVLLFIAVLPSHAQKASQLTLYHEFNNVKLNASSVPALQRFVGEVRGHDIISVTVRSHADIAGTRQFNSELSKERSLYVLEELQKLLPTGTKYTLKSFGEDSLLTAEASAQQNNRRTIVTVYYQEKPIPSSVTKLAPYVEDVQEQVFEVNLDAEDSILAKGGTFLKFAAGTFLNKNKELATGRARLLIREYYKPSDILLSGKHTMSDKGLLQTGGMFTILVIQGQDTMLAETQRPLYIRMPDVNNFPGPMNVFVAPHGDTAAWNDSQVNFNRVTGSWIWPKDDQKLPLEFIAFDLKFERWPVGRKYSQEAYIVATLFNGGLFNPSAKPLAKYLKYQIKKTDSSTISVTLQETFRRKGYKRYGIKTFDTSFVVKYVSAFYEAIVGGANYINCDRFLNIKDVTDFYVMTPGFEQAQVLVYFKDLNAFMPATRNSDGYTVKRVPNGRKVYLVAVGKNGDEYFFGKQEFTISKDATGSITLQKGDYVTMKNMLASLNEKSE